MHKARICFPILFILFYFHSSGQSAIDPAGWKKIDSAIRTGINLKDIQIRILGIKAKAIAEQNLQNLLYPDFLSIVYLRVYIFYSNFKNIMTTEFIALLANLAIALSFIVALVFGIAQVKAAARDRKERLTLETLRTFQTKEFVELMQNVIYRDMPTNREEMESLPDKDRTSIIQFGQVMESLGILVAEHLINIDLIDKTLGSFVTTAWQKFKPLFLDNRVKQPDPYLGEYFQWLAERIDERMQKYPRKPFYLTRTSAV